MSNTTKYVLIATIFILIVIIIYLNRPKSRVLDIKIEEECFKLPTSVDPETFGPAYWKAFHKLASDIPCEGCRTFAEKFMVFFHDVVNKKLEKPVYDQKNFGEVKQTIFAL